MKKYFFFAAVAAMALVACNPESKDKDDNKDEGTIKLEYRIKTLNDKTFTYNAAGKLESYGDDGEIRTLTYAGNKVTIKDKWKEDGAWAPEIVEYEMTLNEQGFATEVKKGDNTFTITYDKNGYFTEAKKNGTKITGQTIEDGNILAWERFDSKNNFWRQKKATYFDEIDNVAQVQTHWAEDLDMPRWLFEARFFGNTSVKVLESCRWWNFGDVAAAQTAVYDYEYDANKCITKEIKYYGVWNESDFTGLDEDTVTTFTWEKIK